MLKLSSFNVGARIIYNLEFKKFLKQNISKKTG